MAWGRLVQAGPPLVCPHGGDSSGGAPPATLEAFVAAADAGFPCVEVGYSILFLLPCLAAHHTAAAVAARLSGSEMQPAVLISQTPA